MNEIRTAGPICVRRTDQPIPDQSNDLNRYRNHLMIVLNPSDGQHAIRAMVLVNQDERPPKDLPIEITIPKEFLEDPRLFENHCRIRPREAA